MHGQVSADIHSSTRINYQVKYKTKVKLKYLHRPGIEPGPPAWQASILPLNHRCTYYQINHLAYLTYASCQLTLDGFDKSHRIQWDDGTTEGVSTFYLRYYMCGSRGGSRSGSPTPERSQLSSLIKSCQTWTPSNKTFWIRACIVFSLNDWMLHYILNASKNATFTI